MNNMTYEQAVGMLNNISMQLQAPNMVNPYTQQDVAMKQHLMNQYQQLSYYINQFRSQQQYQNYQQQNNYNNQMRLQNNMGYPQNNAYNNQYNGHHVSVGAPVPAFNPNAYDNYNQGTQASVGSSSRFHRLAQTSAVQPSPVLSQPQTHTQSASVNIPSNTPPVLSRDSFNVTQEKPKEIKEDSSFSKKSDVLDENHYGFKPSCKFPLLCEPRYFEKIVVKNNYKIREVYSDPAYEKEYKKLDPLILKGKHINDIKDLYREVGEKYFTNNCLIANYDLVNYMTCYLLKDSVSNISSYFKRFETDNVVNLLDNGNTDTQEMAQYLSNTLTEYSNILLTYSTETNFRLDDVFKDVLLATSFSRSITNVKDKREFDSVMTAVKKILASLKWNIITSDENSENKLISITNTRKVLWIWEKEIANSIYNNKNEVLIVSDLSFENLYSTMLSIKDNDFVLAVSTDKGNTSMYRAYKTINKSYIIVKM